MASSSYGTMRENENTERNRKGFDQQLFILTAQCLALVAAFIFLKSLRGDIFFFCYWQQLGFRVFKSKCGMAF